MVAFVFVGIVAPFFRLPSEAGFSPALLAQRATVPTTRGLCAVVKANTLTSTQIHPYYYVTQAMTTQGVITGKAKANDDNHQRMELGS